ncbi:MULTISPECIES: hypothetical protein [unclassified Caballeronia]|uniref:hypothetical protein n=1 Tax=unclassified Caballeronia TaxID=2646786 RepID=UPI0020283FDE|nr:MULTISPECIES: hypothetical protein [unclassified Caballeronia]
MSEASYRFYRNTPEEEAEIERGIQMDPDTYVMSDAEFEAAMRWADSQSGELTANQVTPPR